MKCRLLLVLVLLPTLTVPASAGIIFGKRSKKPTPAERVPELIGIIKSDGDENRRAGAAAELRRYDPKDFPEIVPILIDVLLTDKKPSVRSEAAQSLGKLRPISQQAGQALERALSKDPSMRVRLQARSSLLQYHWAGYRASRKDQQPLIQTQEPPLAGPATAVRPAQSTTPPIITTTTRPPQRLAPQPQAQPMPLPVPAVASPVPPPVAHPLPPGPARPTTEPTPAPEGPDLGPQG